MKIAQPKAKPSASCPAWFEDFSPSVVKPIGVLEFLAAIGLILPAVLALAPVLVPLAALGLVLMMVGAAITHGRRKGTPRSGRSVGTRSENFGNYLSTRAWRRQAGPGSSLVPGNYRSVSKKPPAAAPA